MNSNHFPQDQPRFYRGGVLVLKTNDLRDLALEIDRALGNARRGYSPGVSWRQSGAFELVGFVRNADARRVHSLCQVARCEIPHEFARFFRISQAVLGSDT